MAIFSWKRGVSSTERQQLAPISSSVIEQRSACTDLGKLMGADRRLTVQIVLKRV
jgi:hypothetical protein